MQSLADDANDSAALFYELETRCCEPQAKQAAAADTIDACCDAMKWWLKICVCRIGRTHIHLCKRRDSMTDAGESGSSGDLNSSKRRAESDDNESTTNNPKRLRSGESTGPAADAASSKDGMSHLKLFLRTLLSAIDEPSQSAEQRSQNSIRDASAAASSPASAAVVRPWGRLMAEYPPRYATVTLARDIVSIGKGSRCTICLPDSTLSNLVARIVCQSEDAAVVEGCTSAWGVVKVNSKVVARGERVPLQAGDTVTLGQAPKLFSFVFEPIVHSKPAASQAAFQPGAVRSQGTLMLCKDAIRPMQQLNTHSSHCSSSSKRRN